MLYTVRAIETRSKDIEIEANSEDEAKKLADQAMADGNFDLDKNMGYYDCYFEIVY